MNFSSIKIGQISQNHKENVTSQENVLILFLSISCTKKIVTDTSFYVILLFHVEYGGIKQDLLDIKFLLFC